MLGRGRRSMWGRLRCRLVVLAMLEEGGWLRRRGWVWREGRSLKGSGNEDWVLGVRGDVMMSAHSFRSGGVGGRKQDAAHYTSFLS